MQDLHCSAGMTTMRTAVSVVWLGRTQHCWQVLVLLLTDAAITAPTCGFMKYLH
jgi:hypothetical protein